MAATDTLWVGKGFRSHLYLQSGQFTSTVKTSVDVHVVDDGADGISWDGTNTPWSGNGADKLYLTSGQFTTTVLTSQSVAGIDNTITDISWDGFNTPWTGAQAAKLYLQSGQFTSTLLTSEDISGVDTAVQGISWDALNTPWCGKTNDKLYLQSGQFTSTLLTSQSVAAIDLETQGISWDGTNTPWIGRADDKLYLTSGQFSSTLLTSQDISGTDDAPEGMESNDILGRYLRIDTVVTPGVMALTMAQAGLVYPGFPITIVLSAELTMGLAQESSVTAIGTANIFPSALSLAFVQEGITVVAGEDLSISVLPLALGVIIDEPPPTVLGDVILFLPGTSMISLKTALSLHAPEVSITDDIKIIVTNTRTFAISEYTAMAYNSMAKFNGRYLYAKADGIYEGGGDDDNGADIIASYKTGTFDINATEVQKLRNVWLNFRSDGDIQLFSVGNEINTRWYPFVNSTNGTIHERRQKFERGIKDNHFSFGISNVAGSSFEIKTAKILTEPIRKRR